MSYLALKEDEKAKSVSEQMQEELEPLPGPTASFVSAAGSIMPKTPPDDFYKEGYIQPSKKHRELSDILEQIRNYPTPISMCDEQFDDLLKERDRLWSTKL